MAKKSISLSDVQMLVKLLTPAPVIQPPTNYSADHDLITKLDGKVDNIQLTVNKLTDNYVPKSSHDELVVSLADHEKRIRINTTDITKIQTWGAALLIIVGIAETLLIHYWH